MSPRSCANPRTFLELGPLVGSTDQRFDLNLLAGEAQRVLDDLSQSITNFSATVSRWTRRLHE